MHEDTEAGRSLDDYINSSGNTALIGRRINVLLKGKYVELDVYRIPIKYLKFNLDNTRFEAQKLVYEKHNGPINISTKRGEEAIEKLLLYSNNGVTLSKDAKTLIGDLKRNGQLEPGIITWDGYIINGNRRFACLKYLYKTDPEEKYEYFNTTRLPKGTSEEEYFKIEADMQWSKDLKVGYDPLNKYLMLKRAKLYRMDQKQIASLTHRSVKEINAELAELELIEEYLRTTKDPRDFSQLDGQTEIITEAAKLISLYKNTNEKPAKIVEYKKFIFKFINHFFYSVIVNISFIAILLFIQIFFVNYNVCMIPCIVGVCWILYCNLIL